MIPTNRDPDLDTAVLHALGWTPEKTPGETHTIDDLLEWHAIARGGDIARYRNIETTLGRIMNRFTRVRQETGDYPESCSVRHQTTSNGKDEVSLPYRYKAFHRFTAYGHRLTGHGVYRLELDERRGSSRFEGLRELGDEDLSLLDLCRKMGVAPMEVSGDGYRNRSSEWRIRATRVGSLFPTSIVKDSEAPKLEPQGRYLTVISAAIYDGTYLADNADRHFHAYKACRTAGMSHELTVSLYATDDIDSAIELFRDVGPEYTLAAVSENR